MGCSWEGNPNGFFSLEKKVHCDRIEEILDAVVVRRAASDRDGGHSLRWDCVVGFRQWLVASAAPPGGHCSPGWFIFLQWILWSINYLFFVGNRIKNNLWQLRQSFDLQTSRWKCEMRKTREKIGVFCTLIMKNNFVACHLSVSPGWSSKKEEKKKKVLCGSSMLNFSSLSIRRMTVTSWLSLERVSVSWPWKEPPSSELHVHGWHTLVEDLCSHQLHAGHDLLLVAHQRHAKPLDVPGNGWRTRWKSWNVCLKWRWDEMR